MVQQLTTLLGRFNQGNPVATSSHLLVLGEQTLRAHALSALQLLQAERFYQTDQSLLRNGIVRARYKVERLTALFGESKKRGVGLLTLSPGDSAVSRFVKVRGSSRQMRIRKIISATRRIYHFFSALPMFWKSRTKKSRFQILIQPSPASPPSICSRSCLLLRRQGL